MGRFKKMYLFPLKSGTTSGNSSIVGIVFLFKGMHICLIVKLKLKLWSLVGFLNILFDFLNRIL